MKRYLIVFTFIVLLITGLPAVANEQADLTAELRAAKSARSTDSKIEQEKKAEEAKKKEEGQKEDEEKARKRELEEKAKAQVEERKRQEEREREHERQRQEREQRQREEDERWNHDIFGPTVVVVPAPYPEPAPVSAPPPPPTVYTSPTVPAPTSHKATGGGVYTKPADQEYAPTRTYRPVPVGPQNTFGLVYAPSVSSVDKKGIGLVWLNKSHHGASVWLAGDFEEDDSIIDGPIPHDDFYTEETKRAFGAEYLHSFGNEKVLAIIGLGLAREETEYTDVSNVTGWKWDGGSKSRITLAGQFALQIGLSPNAGLYLGFDTFQKQFFGLTASF